jgi:hypothetical protein
MLSILAYVQPTRTATSKKNEGPQLAACSLWGC